MKNIKYILLTILFLGACTSENKQDSDSEDNVQKSLKLYEISSYADPIEEIVLDSTFLITDIDIDSKGNIYALDYSLKEVIVFDSKGKRMTSFGSEGEGPGEFMTPTDIVINPSEEELLVKDIAGRISYFNLRGDFLTSQVFPELMLANSSIAYVNDSLLVVGGSKYDGEAETLADYDITYLHLYTTSGKNKKDFFPPYPTAIKYNAFTLEGALFDINSDGNIVALQPSEYKFGQFDRAGNLVNEIEVQASHYRPIPSKEPNPADRQLFLDWVKSWDSANWIHFVTDEIIIVGMLKDDDDSPPWMLDIVNIKTGKVLKSLLTHDKLIHVSKEGGSPKLYFTRKLAENKTSVTIQIMSYDSLL